MLKVGDVVSLKSGSHAMTVIEERNDDWVRTIWFVEGKPIQHDFPVDSLKKHD